MAETWQSLGINTKGRTSGQLKTLCPRCSHRRKHKTDPCLSADLDHGRWKCHNPECGFSGYLDGRSWQDGVMPRSTARPKPLPASRTITGKAAAFFEQRGIPLAVAEAAGVYGDDRGMHFPYYRNGELINIKHRWPGKKFSMEAGCELIFYGLDWCAGAKRIVIVEGEMDALALRFAGFDAVLSVPNGAQTETMPFMADAEALFRSADEIVIAVDSDDPGKALAEELARRIGPEKCSRVEWIDGCKDANDVLMEWNAALLRDLVESAKPYPVVGIITPDDEESAYLYLYDHGLTRGLSTGWPTLDRYYTILTGHTTCVTGIPGSGKSEWLDHLMINMAVKHGWRFTVFSPESMPTEEHLSRWAEKYLDKPFLDGPTPRMTRAEAIAAKNWAQNHLSFIVPDEPTLDEILRLARIEVFRHGVKGIVIDPWNELIHTQMPGEREDQYLSRQLRQVRRFNEMNGTHAWIVNHPHAIDADKVSGQYPIVKGYDMNGGAMWLNKSSALISVWRDLLDPIAPVKVCVQKAKTRRIGGRGVAFLRYDVVTGRYTDTGQSEVSA